MTDSPRLSTQILQLCHKSYKTRYYGAANFQPETTQSSTMKNSVSSLGFHAVLSTSVLALTMGLATSATAQVTTSSMRGQVFDSNGQAISGATVTVLHTPSGTRSSAFTNENGVFSARNLRVGGPYTVTVVSSGYQTKAITDISLGLDETFSLDVLLDGGSGVDEVIATGTISTQSYLDTGLSSNFNLAELNRLPSIDRDITDAAQLDPFANVNLQTGGAKELTIGGANNRFNSLTVDGVALNDRFGLNANGYPTQRSPIPFDAIESLAIETAPYDTEFNGFTGGTINAVTKSGTNELHGSAGYFYSSDKIARNDDFKEESYAFTLGGPVIKDKLFLFGAYEKFEEAAALIDGPQGSGALNELDVTQTEVDTVNEILSRVYGFEGGGFDVDPVTEEKYLISADWNITDDHRAKFTYLHNTGSTIRQQDGNSFLEDRRVDILGLSSTWYNRTEEVDTYIGHIFSDWTPNFSTEFKVAYTKQATGQNSLGGAEVPLFTIRMPSGANLSTGPDTFRHGNELDQEFFQVKAKAEYVTGNHTFKVGFEREDVDVDNLFAPSSEGQYFFNSIADLENAEAAELLYENAITNDENDRRAIWGYTLTSLYAQDTWDIRDDLTLQFGLRYDRYGSSGTIRENQNFLNRYGYSNTTDIDGLDVIMPRFSFNWDATDNLRIRGGLGRFSGGSPSVWISNAYSNDGVTNESVFSNAAPIAVPTSPDATTGNYIPQNILNELANQNPDGPVAALNPNFEIPSTVKANLGFAFDADLSFLQLGEDWTLSADVLYNKYENAPFWYDESCVQNSFDAPEGGRNAYICGFNGAPEATIVASVDEGESTLFAVSADKSWETGFGDFDFFTSYTYADVSDIGQGTSSTATSNYSDTARLDYNQPNAGTSNFETRHSFKLRFSWEKDLIEDHSTRFSLFGTRRSGQPYSYTFNTDGRNDVFGIRENRADDAGALLYVPTGINDPLFSSASFGGDVGQQQDFIDYIQSSELARFQGDVAARNAFRSRWSTIVDAKIEQEIPGIMEGHKASAFFAIRNLGNLIDKDWGVVERVRYEYEQQTVSASIQNGQYVFDDLDTTLNLETLAASQWRAQVGIRYEF